MQATQFPPERFISALSAPNQKANAAGSSHPKEDVMLWTICAVLIVLWLAGMVSAYTMGGLIHILLVIAIIMVLVNVIQGRRIV